VIPADDRPEPLATQRTISRAPQDVPGRVSLVIVEAIRSGIECEPVARRRRLKCRCLANIT
jgi:hypothetical protein